MLIEFTVGNYLSFRETVTFSMVAAKISAKDKTIDENNVFDAAKDLRLLKSAAIYGANGSGKSNFIKALSFMRQLVLNSSKETQIAEPIDVEAFRLSQDLISKPSFFQIVFLLEGTKYRYGFEVDAEKVVSEWLFYTPTTKEARLFTRDSAGITLTNTFKEGKVLIDKTRDNALFLSVSSQFNGPIAKAVLGWFSELGIISSLFDLLRPDFTVKKFENDGDKKSVIALIKKLDLGIDDIQIEKIKMTEAEIPKNFPKDLKKVLLKNLSNKTYIRTLHKKYDSNGQSTSTEVFDLENNESEGTKKLFSLAAPLVDSLHEGTVLIIDELDARLHPLITCAVISLFNSNETNPKNAQLVFTTHDTNLLANTIFRRDQIWFTEKNKQGATDMYSLAEFKVRNDKSYEKDYIQGRYGAIPFIGDIQRVIGGGSNGK